MGHCRCAIWSLAMGLMLSPLAAAQAPVGQAQLTFTTIDVPGAGFTSVQGTNLAGDMVGYYGSSSGPFHGFLIRAGVLSLFDYPGAADTRGFGINDSSIVVGSTMEAGASAEIGFSYDGATFAPIRISGKSTTVAWGVDNAGEIVGGDGSPGTTRAFELRGGHLKDISPPGNYVYAYATGINNLGKVVGWTTDGVNTDGFVYSGGTFRTLAVPGAMETEAWGVNDSGVVVGWYGAGAFTYGFALLNGRYLTLAYPGAKGTFAEGVSGTGQIVGSYTFDYISYHGFVTSPI